MTIDEVSTVPVTEYSPSNHCSSPFWNIQPISPKVAPSERTFRTIALSGSSTLPVKRKRIMNVVKNTQSPAIGKADSMPCWLSV